jgi:hypothetical protein
MWRQGLMDHSMRWWMVLARPQVTKRHRFVAQVKARQVEFVNRLDSLDTLQR